MNPILKNSLAIIAGIVLGSFANMGVLELGSILITNPEGFDNSTAESLAATINLLEPINYIPVFLAHALGALVGAFIAAKIAANRKLIFALVIGAFFLLGGAYMISILPSPTWFNSIDIILAYIPMAWLGWKLAGGK